MSALHAGRSKTEPPPRLATQADADAVTRLLVDAFDDDPMWGEWAFPDLTRRRAHRTAVFRLLVDGALRHAWVWLSADGTATSVWTPPGRGELSDSQEQELRSVLASPGVATDRVLRGFDLIERARPLRPHFYLSLLGTDPAFAGHGHGQRLLAANLQRIDAQQAPAYLEARDELVPLYQRYGFELLSAFDLPDGPTVNCLWRQKRH